VLVALDGITDPHNLGAIARSASAFGAAGIVVPSRRSAGVTATAWRSSAGAFAYLPVARATNLARAIGQAQDAGFFVVTLDGGAQQNIVEVAAHFGDVPVMLVVGSEGAGVSRLIAERADAAARIDMPGRAESLNASVAAGIALFAIAGARA
jgi:23S rRNA (guanosine2251-2'-O)-methyltransferase